MRIVPLGFAKVSSRHRYVPARNVCEARPTVNRGKIGKKSDWSMDRVELDLS